MLDNPYPAQARSTHFPGTLSWPWHGWKRWALALSILSFLLLSPWLIYLWADIYVDLGHLHARQSVPCPSTFNPLPWYSFSPWHGWKRWALALSCTCTSTYTYYAALHDQETQECERAVYDQNDTRLRTEPCECRPEQGWGWGTIVLRHGTEKLSQVSAPWPFWSDSDAAVLMQHLLSVSYCYSTFSWRTNAVND